MEKSLEQILIEWNESLKKLNEAVDSLQKSQNQVAKAFKKILNK